MAPILTVVVCTYNRASLLSDCLDSLCAQTIAANSFTVLVVNNNSTDNTQTLAENFANRLPDLRVVFEPKQGLSHARNRGIDEAQTEWVAFLDDDARARPDWAATIVDAIWRNDFDCFGGPYHAWYRFGPPPRWFDPQWETYAPDHPYGPLHQTHIPGGNCALRKNAALSAGKFSASYGMNANKCAYGEETFLFEIMRQQGVRLGFVPAMIIEHCVQPYKYTLRWRLFSIYAGGRDYFSIFPSSTFRLFLRFAMAVLWHFPNNCVRCCKQKFAWQRILLESICPILAAWGSCVAAARIFWAKASKNR